MSSANLLAALTLPVCVLISSLAGPLIAMLYGPAWGPAAPVLAWLAPLATLRVFYVLANDYFAVLASSRRGLIFQLIWLATLVLMMKRPRASSGTASSRWPCSKFLSPYCSWCSCI